jgi:hypothetical protein
MEPGIYKNPKQVQTNIYSLRFVNKVVELKDIKTKSIDFVIQNIFIKVYIC